MVEARESGVPVEAEGAVVDRVLIVEDSLVAAEVLADLAAMAAQVFGGGIGEDDRVKGKIESRWGLLGICGRSVAVGK